MFVQHETDLLHLIVEVSVAEGSGEQRHVSDWQSWHPVTNHPLPLYAVACWTLDGGGMGDAQERSQETRRTSRVRSQCQ